MRIASTSGQVRRSPWIEPVQMALMLLAVAAVGMLLFGLAWGVIGEYCGKAGDPIWLLAWIGGGLAVAFGLAAWLLDRRR